jgi:ABC-type branched-subunit amino acid transport system substrate-binding protein
VIILANNKPLLPLLRDYAPKTVGLPKVIISFVDRQLLLKDLGAAAAGVAFSSVVPEIHKEKFSSVRDFVQAAKRSGIAATQISLEGYITGLAVIEGLRNAKNDTRTALIDGISNVRDLDLSYTRLQFTKGNRGGSNFVSLAVSNGDSVIA